VHPVSPGADGLISPSTFSGVFETNCLAPVPVVAGSLTGSEWVIASPGLPSTIALIFSLSPIAITPSQRGRRARAPVAAFSVAAPTNGNGECTSIRHLFPSHSDGFYCRTASTSSSIFTSSPISASPLFWLRRYRPHTQHQRRASMPPSSSSVSSSPCYSYSSGQTSTVASSVSTKVAC
jgi:hypothetical protein